MSIEKRGQYWHFYITVFKDDKEIRRRGTTGIKVVGKKEKDAARAFERNQRDKLEVELQLNGKIPLFRACSARFHAVHSVGNNKPSEQASKERIIRVHLNPFFGNMPFDQIGSFEVADYKAKKLAALLPDKRGEDGRTYSKKAINNQLTVLATLFSIYKDWNLFPFTIPTIKKYQLEQPKYDFYDEEEVKRMLAVKEKSMWLAMVFVGLCTGLRISEMIPLSWPEVNFTTGKIAVIKGAWHGRLSELSGTTTDEAANDATPPRAHRKNRKSSTELAPMKTYVNKPKGGSGEVPMSAMLATVLKTLPSRFAGGLVFPGPDGKMLKREDCKRPLERLCKLAGVRVVGWHTLRHTFASHLVMRGVPLKVVQELMRHKSILMTMRYAHLSPGTGETAVDKLYKSDEAKPVAGRKNGPKDVP